MIPKKIHYCWFGGTPLPASALKCIESWKKYCPDYEIIEWNESNFDVTCCDYVKEAYEAKKWAFVSDYARFKILYDEGGLYFDTDVELIKPLDEIVARGNFMGRETESKPAVAPGLGLGANPGLGLYKELLEAYHSRHFLNADGTMNQTTIVDYTTEILLQHGLENKNEIQFVAEVYVYPKEYFCPQDFISGETNITDNTVSIHHYSCSWYSEVEEYALKLKKKYNKFLPHKLAGRFAHFVAQCKFDGIKKAIKRTVGRIKGKKK